MIKKRIFSLLLLFLAGLTLPALAQDDLQKAQSLFRLGVFAFEDGDYRTAENHLTQSLAHDNGNAYTNYYLGKVYLQKGDFSRAAVYFDKAMNLEKNLPDLAYHWAYVNYQLKNFAVAEGLFEALIQSQPDNVMAYYYAGLAMYKQDKFQPALGHLSRAAQMDTPARYNADYHAALCDLRLKNVDSARERLTRVKENAAESELRQAAAGLLEKIAQQDPAARRYALVAKAGWEYDDNEVLEPIDNDEFYADEEDHIFSLLLSASYDFIRTDNFILGAGYSHYVTKHDEFEEFDLTGSLFDLYARFRLQDYFLTLSYNPDYYWLDSESYLCRHEFRTTVSREFGAFLTELAYNHQRDNNLYDSDRDGSSNEAFLRCQYALPDDAGSLRAGIGYEVSSADHRDYDYDMITTEVAATFNLPWGIALGLSGECEMQDYDHVDSSYGRRRDDTRYIANALLSRDIIKDVIAAHLGYEYTKNNSNIDDLARYGDDHEYESNAFKIFLTAKI